MSKTSNRAMIESSRCFVDPMQKKDFCLSFIPGSRWPSKALPPRLIPHKSVPPGLFAEVTGGRVLIMIVAVIDPKGLA